jgi:hypothetical protein
MTKPVYMKQHILQDDIVLDGIRSINVLKDERKINGRISGGMAVQSYLPRELHRGTIDLDFSLLWNGCSTEYRKLCLPLIDFLEKEGYLVSFRKKGLAYEITYARENGKDSFIIQHPHKSNRHFEKTKHTLEREIANQHVSKINGLEFGTMSPEDLIVSKTNRALIFSERYGLKLPLNKSITSLAIQAQKLKEDILPRGAEACARDVALLRLVNDLYDLKCLSEHVEVDSNYLKQVLSEWGHRQTEIHDLLAEEINY